MQLHLALSLNDTAHFTMKTGLNAQSNTD